MQLVAPVFVNVFVTLPAPHGLQFVAPVCRSLYIPAVQFWQAGCEFGENVPATQGVHVDPPDDDKVFVTLPATQLLHAACEFGENVPASHGVHADPPDDDNVSVTLPAAQVAHAVCESAEYWPATH